MVLCSKIDDSALQQKDAFSMEVKPRPSDLQSSGLSTRPLAKLSIEKCV